MKIFVCCSKHFYSSAKPFLEELEKKGHKITLPNSYEDPFKEEKMKKKSVEEHRKWKSEKLKEQVKKIKNNSAILVLNFEKKGIKNYIGGATFLEIYEAWKMKKKIFLFNHLPNCSFTDELKAINPIILNGDLSKIK
ncbi:MAG: hypothetical protein KJ949_02670 [Nanoarchaeota archaeon]|nr:hypothetical protein [Nanoarchaeota archaeon]MBU4308630.1 hypothetical protein [Nanoarchaeota archaeon]